MSTTPPVHPTGVGKSRFGCTGERINRYSNQMREVDAPAVSAGEGPEIKTEAAPVHADLCRFRSEFERMC